ncbi:uncharacterized protein F4822DRAFT_442992 [Hypoxylon trugodes]|uniref:uncharacterized protein n=1 Tax=Hypoxylon trugodes TaxID=326681 RepID=UPI00219BD4CE|nr:uncharacterized protein F4822DRAFT_442992 [Hypoxylon trugodes]KAI1389938.1 hypothetical protein F4822DRAFT_442992 [Hypoxylon trugodes]
MAPFLRHYIFWAIPTDLSDKHLGDADKLVDCDPRYGRDSDFYDQRYAQSPIAEPLSDNMVHLVRSQLVTLFYESIAYGHLQTFDFKYGWYEYIGNGMRSYGQPRLHPRMFVPRNPSVRGHLLEYADVQVAVYFDQLNDYSPFHEGFSSRTLGRFQQFAKPIGLTGSEPRDIKGIREFHSSLCDVISIGLSQQMLPKPGSPTYHPVQPCLQPGCPEQPQLIIRRTYKEQGQEMAHLFRAIVIIVDNQVIRYKEPEFLALIRTTGCYETRLPDTQGRRDWNVSQDAVLLFRTGDDAHLSSPISFQSLYDPGKALPVNRRNCDDDGTNVVRVNIDIALEFILDLIVREREAIPSVGLAAATEYRQHLEVCEKWVDGVMDHAGRVGIDTNGFTWHAVRRAQAAQNGEAFDYYQIEPTWNHLGVINLPSG